MNFENANSIESACYYLRFADYPRASNRALIDRLFNGESPFTPEEQAQNRITVNCNFLDATRIHQDACRQFSAAIGKPGNYFSVKLESGPIHRRGEWSDIITAEINKRMKASLPYTETLHNVFAQVVLHGVGPVTWPDKQTWCPDMHAMADVLVPSRTLLTMSNLSHFAIYRRYTAAELYRKINGPRVDAGWNIPVVKSAIAWAQTQFGQTNTGYDTYLAPEKWAEDLKANDGFWASDQVPTINAFDFWYLDDSKKEWGWKRRIILDCETTDANALPKTNILGKRDQFLFNPGDRNYASKLSEILHCQFGDGSVVAPFRYHSVRSLGWLLYSVCHLQNRLRCKLNDATFESLLNYFRVSNPDDAERLQKVDLINLGIIPDGLTFVPAQERWQVNPTLSQQTMLLNRQSMAENSTSYTENTGYDETQKRPEKTATQVTAEVNAATAMVGSMLNRAYTYQTFQYSEISRRFCIKNSKDGDVKKFQAACLRRGVPQEMLDVERWNVAPVRVTGNGNKQLEISQTGMLMQFLDRYDPDAQRIILRDFTFAATDDPAKTLELVPQEKNLATDSVHDAELSASTMLLGLQMNLKQSVNHAEYCATLCGMVSMTLQKIEARGGVATADELAGMQNCLGQSVDGQNIPGNGAMNHVMILAQREDSKSEVKQLSDVIGQLLNKVKALAQQLAESQQQQGSKNGGLPAEDAVALKAKLVQAETDAKIKEESARQKLEHSEQKFRQKFEQTQARDELANAGTIRKTQVDESAKDLQTAASIQRDSQKPDVAPA